MKKMTIALFTAAAMGASGFAVAADVTGPTVSGRVQASVTDEEGGDLDLFQENTKLAVSGGATGLAGGLEGYYNLRVDLEDSGVTNGAYTYVGVKGDFGDFRVGKDDDLAYKFALVETDVLRELQIAGQAFDGGLGSVTENSDIVNDNGSAQYHYSFGNLTAAGYVQTSDAGVDPVQLGVHADLGSAQVGVVYSDDDSSGEDTDAEFHLGGSVDAGVATIIGAVSDKRNDTNPYTIGAQIPTGNIWTATVLYGNDDAADAKSDVIGQMRANLGGGLAWNISVRNGDTGDAIGSSLRYTF